MKKILLKEIPLIFAVDNNYAPYLGVAIKSILANASTKYFYSIYVLNTDLSEENREKISKYESENVRVEFVDVKEQLDLISGKLHLRDYYTNTTYYRFFIPSLFTQYSKALYLDADIIVLDDISKLFNEEIGENLAGAVQEEVMATVKVFGDYVEECLDVPCEEYFNAGVLVMNLDKMREEKIEEGFVSLLRRYKFEVTQDQDYLNILCQNKTKIIQLGWNKTPIKNKKFNDKNLKLIHYKIAWKPWHYDGVLYGEHFWKYAKETEYYDEIIKEKENHDDAKKLIDQTAYENIVKLALKYTNDENNYKKMKEREQENEISTAIEYTTQNCRI